MQSDDPIVRDLEIMSAAGNYNAWLFSQLRSGLGKRVLEIGAGVGNFTALLLDRDLVVASDPYAPCVSYLRGRFPDARNLKVLTLDISSPDSLRARDLRIDSILCMNVLEHVEDDAGALTNMLRILEPGGRLALLVPAFPCLFGSIDRLVGHHRRYTREDLRRKVGSAGFTITRMRYLNSLAVFGWFLNNRVLRKKEESPAQVRVYDRAVVPWLSRIEAMVPPPFGLSLVLIAEKGRDRE